MTYAEAIQFLYGLRLFGAKFGLENTIQLAALAGNPQEKLRFIHVAGTNGKGSTCAMLDAIYRAGGWRVGLFTSPHLVSFRERIQVNRQLIPEADVVRLVQQLREYIAAGVPPAVEPGILPGGPSPESKRTNLLRAHPTGETPASTSGGTPNATFFEVITVMALKFFAEQKCDLVIWETGLGGRLDATNIVTPLASVITNIALDHQQWLGETLEKIAFEKAGIIKPGVPVITATDAPEALAVIEKIAEEKNAPLTRVQNAGRGTRNTEPSLPGEHQHLNAALALATVQLLQRQVPVAEKKIQAGLANVNWPGRLQLVQRKNGREILLDGAHNVAGAKVLAEAIQKYFPHIECTLVIGIFQDKDWQHICDVLAPLAKKVVTVPVSSDRTADPHALAEECQRANPAAKPAACVSLAEALETTADDDFVIVTGSLYLVGEALELLGLSPAAQSERALNEWSSTRKA